jgi:hypothetical protein
MRDASALTSADTGAGWEIFAGVMDRVSQQLGYDIAICFKRAGHVPGLLCARLKLRLSIASFRIDSALFQSF